MLVLGIESSCDDTGVALYDTEHGLLAHRVHSQIDMHAEYGGVVPELASRDHIRRVVPLTQACLQEASRKLSDLNAIAYTAGPGLNGALLVGASIANALAYGLNIPVIEVHHLEGHLLSPMLATPAPSFPFVALLVSGGHTQLMLVRGVGDYTLLGETLDDAAGEAFDKTAKLVGFSYPGGPQVSAAAEFGDPMRFTLPRPMLTSKNLDMSFSGLKTAVRTLVREHETGHLLDEQTRNDICRAFQDAVVEVLLEKSLNAIRRAQVRRLVVAGGVGANKQLRAAFTDAGARYNIDIFFPPLALCSDNGAMIAYAGAQRLALAHRAAGYTTHPRWDLTSVPPLPTP